ncbi:MAG: hypothetical protein CL678_18215 [Bdellovibrionaceae bacterium]|nr:hypothetical protein [Pseudobdellovibrionaceae bacterium]|tara:strand:+ start:309 stop:767 length:459 start_codon:yes stop_codon:yes gene_type:complete
MWQTQHPKAKAAAVAKKKRQEENRKNSYSLKRVSAELKVGTTPGQPQKIIDARVVLNDFRRRGVSVFTKESMPIGEMISVTLERPKRFYCRAKIVQCEQKHNAGMLVLSKENFNYRLALEFVFDSDEEKESIAEYCKELIENYLYPPSKQAA